MNIFPWFDGELTIYNFKHLICFLLRFEEEEEKGLCKLKVQRSFSFKIKFVEMNGKKRNHFFLLFSRDFHQFGARAAILNKSEREGVGGEGKNEKAFRYLY